MAINLELPRKMQAVTTKTHQGAAELMRPIARKYDLKEHAYPVELDTLFSLFEGPRSHSNSPERTRSAARTKSATRTTTAPTWPRYSRRWKPAGATSR